MPNTKIDNAYNTTVTEASIVPQETYAAAPNDFPPSAAARVAPAAVIQNGPGAVVQSKYLKLDTRKPVTLSYCPNCSKEQVTTQTRTTATGGTWLAVGAGFFIFPLLCWIPLVVDGCKQTNHHCQNCGAKVARVKAFN